MLSYILGKVCRYRSGVCIQNLSRSFPGYSYNEINACAEAFYRNLSRIVWETCFPSLTKLVVHLSALQIIKELGRRQRPVILLLGHYGNWEVLNKLPQCTGMPVKALYKPIRIQWIDTLVRKRRIRYGLELVKSGQALKVLLNNKDHNSLLLFVADQFPGNNKGIEVDFLHQETRMFAGAEQLARRLDAAVAYLELSARPGHTWEMDVQVICESAAGTTEGSITRTYARMLEKSIQRAPAWWLWSHRRWK
ncbi:MAG: lysophospholipid acyltransferase family protein [Candidatus Pseudobacter hemicellulosilyticus]|uniref:Lysophospholipid acyltransferase family protein n=1 Tax=Candidatus Pseudobacter hemicellulosilyticus TaxID=3121375 RepID=A0AAJ5WLR3_9BACT|nr:MAG: lysophospholipid acyltransferase family protein [Pseudobacter sp.]